MTLRLLVSQARRHRSATRHWRLSTAERRPSHSSRLSLTKRRRAIPQILVGALFVLTSATALQSVSTSTTAPAQFRDDYKPLPTSMLTNGEILFTRLRTSQLSAVRTIPSVAVRIAEALYGGSRHGSRIVLVSLGAYVDKNQIIHDWIGTRSLKPAAVPSYAVRIFEPHVVTVGPSTNHYWNVIVNATNGRIISAFSYD